MVCLDTSVLVPIIRKEKAVLERLRTETDLSVSTTMINLCELYRGVYGSKNPERELEKVQSLASTLRILDLNDGAGRRYGELVNSAALKRNPIGDFDLIISCIAMEFGETLITRNTEHFGRVPGLKIDTW